MQNRELFAGLPANGWSSILQLDSCFAKEGLIVSAYDKGGDLECELAFHDSLYGAKQVPAPLKDRGWRKVADS